MISPGHVEDVEGRQILPAVDVDVEHTLERRIERRLCLVDAHDVVAVGHGDLVREVGCSEPLFLVESLDKGTRPVSLSSEKIWAQQSRPKRIPASTSARAAGQTEGQATC